MHFKHTTSIVPFNKWLWQDTENRRLIWLSIAIMVISFTWLKILYPLPNFMPPDSNSYIEAAQKNQFINFWSIGYSKFLRMLSCFSSFHFILTLFQYLLLVSGLLYLLFSIRHLLNPGYLSFRMLLVLSIANPLLPHIANFVSSDCLFTALSLVWFTQLLWLISQPKIKLIFFHSLILLLCFMVRYNALIYPFTSMITIIFLTHLNRRIKLFSFIIIAFPLFVFIGATQLEYQRKTGTVQFSAFGGWQIAANALYGYSHSQPDDPSKVPYQFQELHKLVNQHLDSLKHLTIRPDREVFIYYLWDLKSPLIKHMLNKMQQDTSKDYFVRWAKQGPLYNEYGCFLIINHPFPFIKYFLVPNFIKYYVPPTKFMGYYNLGNETVDSKVATWFGWKNNKVYTLSKNKIIWITEPFTVIIAVVNLIFLLSFIMLKCIKKTVEKEIFYFRILNCVLTVWILNMLFSVFSAPIELRYQIFPFVITACFVWLMISHIIKLSSPINKNTIVAKECLQLS